MFSPAELLPVFISYREGTNWKYILHTNWLLTAWMQTLFFRENRVCLQPGCRLFFLGKTVPLASNTVFMYKVQASHCRSTEKSRIFSKLIKSILALVISLISLLFHLSEL